MMEHTGYISSPSEDETVTCDKSDVLHTIEGVSWYRGV